MLDVIDALDARIERVEITRVDAPVFYAAVVISGSGAEHQLDARPSDAIALAVRSNAPIYVEDDVMNRAGTASSADAEDGEGELERFDRFVQTLSPDELQARSRHHRLRPGKDAPPLLLAARPHRRANFHLSHHGDAASAQDLSSWTQNRAGVVR